MPKRKKATALQELMDANPDRWNFPSRESQAGLGDIEFASDVASAMGPLGYVPGVIDPSKAQYFGTTHSNPMTVLGRTNVGDKPNEFTYEKHDAPYPSNRAYGVLEPGNVSAIGVGATPQIWAHEYRHRLHPGMSEKSNRIRDAYSARTEEEFMDVAKIYASYYKMPLEQAVSELEDAVWSQQRHIVPISESEYRSGARFGNEENIKAKTLGEHYMELVSPKSIESLYRYQDQRDNQSWVLKKMKKEGRKWTVK